MEVRQHGDAGQGDSYVCATFGKARWIAATLMFVRIAVTMPAFAEAITVTIENLSFKPAEAQAKVGDTIVRVNNDILDHAATACDKSFDIVQPAKKSASQSLTADQGWQP